MSHPDIHIPDSISDEDATSSGLYGTVVKKGGLRVFEMHKDATADQWGAANSFFNPPRPQASEQSRIALTNTWLSLKALLDCLPSEVHGQEDPYAAVRQRLKSQVKASYKAMMDAGHPA